MYKIVHQSENSMGNKLYNAYTYGNKSYSTHFHKSPELLYVLKGTLSLKINETEHSIKAGEWAMVLSKQLHSFRVGRDCLVWVAVFSEDFVPEFAAFVKDKQGKQVVFHPQEDVDRFVINHLILDEPTGLMKKACLNAICDQYLRCTELENRNSKTDDLLCGILEYIEENYHENITLHSVAQAFGYEYHYLSRLLGKSYHIRFKNLLNGCRIEHAILLLESGEYSVTEIAMRCGFQSIRSFNDVFLATTGSSPTKYKKMNL